MEPLELLYNTLELCSCSLIVLFLAVEVSENKLSFNNFKCLFKRLALPSALKMYTRAIATLVTDGEFCLQRNHGMLGKISYG